MTKTFRVSADAREWRLSVRAASTVPQRYYGRATKWQLRRLALLQGMRPLRQLTHRELECGVYANQCAVRIQRWVRRAVLPWHRAKRTVARRLALRVTNKEDPITMDALPPPERVFKFVRPTRQVVGFDAVRLAEYINTSGRFEDPATRFPFTPVDLWRLDKQVRDLGYQRHSTLFLYSHPEIVRAMREHESLVVGLERMVVNIAQQMGEILAEEGADHSTLGLISSDYLPDWRSFFRHLHALDPNSARSTMDNCCQVLRNEMEGLPENDQGDTRRGCLAALSMVMSTYLTTCGVATLALQADQPGLLVFF